MRVGLCFDGFYSIQEMIELARLADEIGMDSIWMSDHLCFRDSLTTSMALLASTRKIGAEIVSSAETLKQVAETTISSAPFKRYAM